jgi:hypothetical protein
MIVKNQSNIKVHFAGLEGIPHAISSLTAGVDYGLATAFNGVFKLFKNGKMDDKRLIQNISQHYKHFILDSGLFTLMFGSHKGKKDEAYLDKWYQCLTEYVLHQQYKGTMVEVDCQKVLGPEKAWQYRIQMRDKMPNRIINVFHLEDGQKGLDRMIEFSDYIAISVPELRFMNKKEYLYKLASYIKNKKPSIDIHLLGFSEKVNLEKYKFCSSCDSTSWLAPVKYGLVDIGKNKLHIKNLKEEVWRQKCVEWEHINKTLFPEYKTKCNPQYYGTETYCASQSLKTYTKFAGPQD